MNQTMPNWLDEKWCKEALERPDSFGYHGDLPLFETWSLGPCIETRDSEALEKSNSEAIQKMFSEREDLEGKWEVIHTKHWAVGWCDHLAFEVYQEDGSISPAAILMAEIQGRLEEYPVLDEMDFSEKEHEETMECWSGYACSDFEHALEFHFDLDLYEVFREINQYQLFHKLFGEWWKQDMDYDCSHLTAENLLNALKTQWEEENP